MREIKFRAWDKVKKEMVFKFLLCPTTPTWGAFIDRMTEQTGKAITESEKKQGADDFSVTTWGWLADSGDWYGIKELEVMQWTGFLDKKGNEIYEGDILKAAIPDSKKTTYNTGEVYWEESWCGYAIGQMRMSAHALGDCVILGNIHQNPELLP